MPKLLLAVALLTSCVSIGALADSPNQSAGAVATKDWTFLVFLNGNNNLDSFGYADMNEMEKVGSTDKINVVVQWASMREDLVKRVYVQKDNDSDNVTSPVVESGKWDMGDYKELVAFVKWAVEKYPAKHYFIDIWDHGAGWHLAQASGDLHTNDISFDDKTGHKITTEELGLALKESAQAIGHKVDIYGSDACLMNMAEVAGEFASSVGVMVGSQEVEPGPGWPYDHFLNNWMSHNNPSAADIGKILVEEYIKSYAPGGTERPAGVTFSALDLKETAFLNMTIKKFAKAIASLPEDQLAKAKLASEASQRFYYSDYVDLQDFSVELEKSGVKVNTFVLDALRYALSRYVIANGTTATYEKSHGLSVWLPTSSYEYSDYSERYGKLKFNQATQWTKAIAKIVK